MMNKPEMRSSMTGYWTPVLTTSLPNSGSKSERLQRDLINERRRKRLESNRESARRSRIKKQKHLDGLKAQLAQLSKENRQTAVEIDVTTKHYVRIETENSVMRAQLTELNDGLNSLNQIISFAESYSSAAGGFGMETVHSAVGGFGMETCHSAAGGFGMKTGHSAAGGLGMKTGHSAAGEFGMENEPFATGGFGMETDPFATGGFGMETGHSVAGEFGMETGQGGGISDYSGGGSDGGGITDYSGGGSYGGGITDYSGGGSDGGGITDYSGGGSDGGGGGFYDGAMSPLNLWFYDQPPNMGFASTAVGDVPNCW